VAHPRCSAGILVLVVVGMLLAGCGSNEEPTSSGDDSQSQASQSQAAEPSASSTVVTLEASSEPTTQSPDLYSADAPDLPDGDADQIAVVATGDYDGTSLPVIVRNNTGDNVARVAMTAEARDASGGLAAAGESQGFIPNVVEPGELAIGYLYFSGAHVPDDAEITIEVTSDESLAEFENIVGLSIAEANGTRHSIVGLVQNPYDIGVMGPIDVEAVCFSQDGQLTVGYSAFAVKDTLAPADTSLFQIDVFEGPCDRFLMGASGFTEF
jgi:hypothetical protein